MVVQDDPPGDHLLLHGLSMIYSTHVVAEILNMAIVAYMGGLAVHVVVHGTHVLLTSSVHVEMVWLLLPSMLVLLMLCRVLLMQTAEEDITGAHHLLATTAGGSPLPPVHVHHSHTIVPCTMIPYICRISSTYHYM